MSPYDSMVQIPGETRLDEPSDVRTAVAFLRRNRLLLVSVALIAAAAAFGSSLLQQERYRASARILYTADIAGNAGDPERVVQTIVAVGNSTQVLQPVAATYGYRSASVLEKDVSITADKSADLMTVRATAGHPKRAADVANAVANELIQFRSERLRAILQARIAALQQQLEALAGRTNPSAVAAAADLRTQLSQTRAELAVLSSDLSLVSRAEPPRSAYSPRPMRNAFVGLLAGIVLGLLIGGLRDRLDSRIRSPEEVEQLYGVPALGFVRFSRGGRPHLADFAAHSPDAAAYRAIRTNLGLFGTGDTGQRIIVVTSAIPGEGKTSVTANLACALAASGQTVLAVSGDMHSPRLQMLLRSRAASAPATGAPTSGRWMSAHTPTQQRRVEFVAGLVEVLEGAVPLERAVRPVQPPPGGPWAPESLWVLASDRRYYDPAALYTTEALTSFYRGVRSTYDAVLIDAPPLLAAPEAAILARTADATIVVARVDHLTKNQARRAQRFLHGAGAAPTGVIVTGALEEVEEFGYAGYSGLEAEPVQAHAERADHPRRAPAEVATRRRR